MEFMEFVVNGTLMRGLALEENLLKVRARFLREGRTEKVTGFGASGMNIQL